MTTNKPGSVNQQPLYGCTSCYEEVTYPAGDLGVYGGECWCEYCWDNRSADFTDQPEWNGLEPFTPVLQAECEKLLIEAQENKDRYFREVYGLNNEGDPIGGEPADGLVHQVERLLEERNELRDECEKLRKDAERYRWLRDKSESLHSFYLSTPVWMTGVRFHPENVNRTIDAAMQGDKS